MACCASRAGLKGGREGDKCDGCRTWEEEVYWKRFKHLHFCQILGSDVQFHKQLMIPRKFADNARALLPPKVTLRGPGGASWYAIITTRGENLFLSDGWEEFAEAYSLKTTNILIFNYDGVSVFDVLIFDGENLCEKESAYFVKNCGHTDTVAERKRRQISSEVDTEEDNGDAPHIDEATKQTGEEEVGQKVADEPRRKLRNTKSRTRSNARREKLAASSKASPAKKVPATRSENLGNNSFARLGKSVLQKATSIPEPETPTAMREIPSQKNASQSNGTFSAAQHATLSNGASPLSVKEVIRKKKATQNIASPKGRAKKRLGARGVKKASASSIGGIQSENHTKKVTSVDGLEFEMGAAQGVDNDVSSGSPGSLNTRYVSEEGKMALERARKEMTESSFVLVMRPTSVHRRFIVTVPPAFQKEHLAPKSYDVFLRIGDKSWVTGLTYNTVKGTAIICRGWRQFVKENKLEQFDVCLFNLVSHNEDSVMLDVSIFRAGPVEAVPLRQVMSDPSIHVSD